MKTMRRKALVRAKPLEEGRHAGSRLPFKTRWRLGVAASPGRTAGLGGGLQPFTCALRGAALLHMSAITAQQPCAARSRSTAPTVCRSAACRRSKQQGSSRAASISGAGQAERCVV